MKTLVIYDSSNGKLVSSMTGDYIKPEGEINYAEVDVPDGRYVISMDVSVTPHVPVLSEAPIDPIAEKFKELEQRLNAHDDQIANAENIAYMGLECAVEVYEEVFPFLP